MVEVVMAMDMVRNMVTVEAMEMAMAEAIARNRAMEEEEDMDAMEDMERNMDTEAVDTGTVGDTEKNMEEVELVVVLVVATVVRVNTSFFMFIA